MQFRLVSMLNTTNRPAALNDSDDLVSFVPCEKDASHGHHEAGQTCKRCDWRTGVPGGFIVLGGDR